jgi:hypothetical protein
MRRYDGTTLEAGAAGKTRAPAAPDSAAARALVAQRLADPDAVLGIQRSVGNAAVVQLLADGDQAAEQDRSPVLDVVGRGGGQPLDEQTRGGMEQALGADLSDVRIHNDGAAAASAQAVQAHAYTVGNDVVFGSGLYQPDTPAGQRMLAHELTHVVQQRNGPVDGTATGDGIAVSDPSDRFEQAAEANADRVMSAGGVEAHAASAQLSSSGSGPTGASGSTAQREAAPEDGSVPGASLQREAAPEEEEEPVQGVWVQREDAPEEEEAPS